MQQQRNKFQVKRAASFLSLLAMLGSLFMPAWSAPSGGTVTNGNATINQSGNTTTINQSSNKAIIHWQQFGSNANESINFQQPSSGSVTLNQIFQNSPSVLLGTLTANGHVWLLNPSGVVFGPGSVTNVGGVLASTLSMADSDFINGNYHLLQDPSRPYGAVVIDNSASINATSANFIAPLVYQQSGSTITANFGRAIVDGITEEVVYFDPQGLIQFTHPVGANIPAGPVVMRTADVDNLLKAVVNDKGIMPAGSITQNADGTTTLGGASGSVVMGGQVTANGGAAAKSANIMVDANHSAVLSRASLVATAPANKPGGIIQVASDQRILLGGTDVTSVGSLGSITMDAAGWLNIAGGTISLKNGGDLNLISGGDLDIGGNSLISILNGNNLNLSGGDIWLLNSKVEGNHNADINLLANYYLEILDGSDITHSYGDNLLIQANVATNINGSKIDTDHDGNLNISGGATTIAGGSSISHTLGGWMTIGANNPGYGFLTVDSSTITNTSSTGLQMYAARDFNVSYSAINGVKSGDTTLSASGNISLLDVTLSNSGGSQLNGAGQLAVYATGGLGVGNSTITNNDGTDLILGSWGAMTIDHSTVSIDHGGSLKILASGSGNGVLDLNYATISNTNTNTNLANSGNTDIFSGSDIWMTRSTEAATGITGDVTFDAERNMAIGDASTIGMSGGRDLNLFSEFGTIGIGAGSAVLSDNNRNEILTANNDIIVDNATVRHALAPKTVLTAGHNIEFINQARYDSVGVNYSLLQAANTVLIAGALFGTLDCPTTQLSAGNNVSLSQAAFYVTGGSLQIFSATQGMIFSNSGTFAQQF